VDDVILDAPYVISPEMIAALSISVVVTGRVSESARDVHDDGAEVFAAAEARGILVTVDSDQSLTVGGILSRIRANAERLETKVRNVYKTQILPTTDLQSYC